MVVPCAAERPTLTLMSTQVPISDELRSVVGSPTHATLLDSSPRSLVWRVELRGGGRVIVKQIAGGGGTGHDGDARYAREVAALRLAARAARPTVAGAARNGPGVPSDGPGALGRSWSG